MAFLPNRIACVPRGMRVLALPLLCAFAGCHQPAASSSDVSGKDATVVAPIAIAQQVPLANTFVVAGEFLPYQEVELHAKVAGYIKSIRADIGDHVHQGEVLATLDIPELEAQVQGADATVRQSTERISQAKSDVQRAQANYVAFHSASERLQRASKAQPGLIAQQELDDAAARDQAAYAQVDAAKSALAGAQQGLQVSSATSLQYTSMANYSRIVAPFNGIVTWRYADTGALIQAGTSNSASMPVLKIAEVNKLRLRVPIPAALVPSVKLGDAVSVTIDAIGRTIKGTITRTTGSLDMATRTEQVEIDIPNSDGTLQPGMFGKVSLDLRSGNVLSVPVNAVDSSTGQPFVMLVDGGGVVHKRDISEGISTPDRVEVASGLNPGDKVIVANLSAFNDGEHVTPKISVLGGGNAEGK
jgi:RND family efflux transporter MFP subunit